MGPMQLKCRVYRDRAGEWRWRWKAANGRVVADSGEGYESYAAARQAAERVAAAQVQMPTRQLVRRARPVTPKVPTGGPGLAVLLAATRPRR